MDNNRYNPFESDNDRDVQRFSNTVRHVGLKVNKVTVLTLMSTVAAIINPDMTYLPELEKTAAIPAALWVTGLHYYLKSDAGKAIETISDRGVIGDILHQRGRDLVGRHRLSGWVGKILSKDLLQTPRHYQTYLAQAAMKQQIRGDVFTLMKQATETVNKDNLVNLYSQYRQVDVNTLHLAVLLGVDHSDAGRKLKADNALSDPVVQQIFAQSKRLLPTLADNLPSTHAFLRSLRGALGEDVRFILKEPTNTLKALKEYNSLCLNMIQNGAKHAENAYIAQVISRHTHTLIDTCRQGEIPLPTLMECLYDIQNLKESLTPRVMHYAQQQQGVVDPAPCELKPLMQACDKVLRKYRPLLKEGLEALPADLKTQLFEQKKAVDLSGFTLHTDVRYAPTRWPSHPDAQHRSVHRLLFGADTPVYRTDPQYAFMRGVEEGLENAILNTRRFYDELNGQPVKSACKDIINRVLERTLMTQLANGEIAIPQPEATPTHAPAAEPQYANTSPGVRR